MEVHGRLGASGRARREGEHRHVVGAGVAILVCRGLALRADRHVLGCVPGIRKDPQARDVGALEVGQETVVAQGQVDGRDLADGCEFAGAEHGHRGHDDGTDLEGGKPQRDQPRMVRAAEEDPLARHDPQVVDEDMGEAVGLREEVSVGPDDRVVSGPNAGAIPGATVDMIVEEHGRDVESIRVGQPGHVEVELRPGIPRGQVVAGEGVDVGARRQWCGVRHEGPPIASGGGNSVAIDLTTVNNPS